MLKAYREIVKRDEFLSVIPRQGVMEGVTLSKLKKESAPEEDSGSEDELSADSQSPKRQEENGESDIDVDLMNVSDNEDE